MTVNSAHCSVSRISLHTYHVTLHVHKLYIVGSLDHMQALAVARI